MTAIIPRTTDPLWVGNSVSRPWYAYLRQMSEFAGATDAQLAAIVARIVALEDAPGQRVQGIDSIRSSGVGDSVQVSLVGDADAPGNTYFYGTTSTGDKGWFPVADALTQGVGIALTVDPDTGLIDIAHADTSSLSSFATVNAGGVVVQNITMSYDTFGHATFAFIETIDLDARYASGAGVHYTRIAADGSIRTAADSSLRIAS